MCPKSYVRGRAWDWLQPNNFVHSKTTSRYSNGTCYWRAGHEFRCIVRTVESIPMRWAVDIVTELREVCEPHPLTHCWRKREGEKWRNKRRVTYLPLANHCFCYSIFKRQIVNITWKFTLFSPGRPENRTNKKVAPEITNFEQARGQ